LNGLRVVPQPHRPIPIWIGGASVAALDRAVRIGTGWHGLESDATAIADKIGYLREHRPEDEFRISNRINYLSSQLQDDEFAGRVKAFEAVGVQDLVIVPSGADLESWLLSVDRIAEITAGHRRIPCSGNPPTAGRSATWTNSPYSVCGSTTAVLLVDNNY
jgi:hypothetical protein